MSHIEQISEDTTEERYLRSVLADLQKSYAKAAQPYIDRLVAIQGIKQPVIIVPLEHIDAAIMAMIKEM